MRCIGGGFTKQWAHLYSSSKIFPRSQSAFSAPFSAHFQPWCLPRLASHNDSFATRAANNYHYEHEELARAHQKGMKTHKKKKLSSRLQQYSEEIAHLRLVDAVRRIEWPVALCGIYLPLSLLTAKTKTIGGDTSLLFIYGDFSEIFLLFLISRKPP